MLVDVLILLRWSTRSMDNNSGGANIVLLVDTVDAYLFVEEMRVH